MADNVDLEYVTRQAIATVLAIPIEDIIVTDNLVDDLDADSLDQVRIAMELEEALNIRFPDHEFDKIKTVNDIVKVLFVVKGMLNAR